MLKTIIDLWNKLWGSVGAIKQQEPVSHTYIIHEIPKPDPVQEMQQLVNEIKEDSIRKNNIEDYCKQNGLNFRTVRAIMAVESNGIGFVDYPNLGKYPKLRFEPHWFNKYEKTNPMPFTDNGRGFSSIASETNSFAYAQALKRNKNAAIKSTSYGKYQIMGFHYAGLGYENPQEFLESMMTEEGQDLNFIKFVMRNRTMKYVLSLKDEEMTLDKFKMFARSYNGSGNVDNYANKMKARFDNLK